MATKRRILLPTINGIIGGSLAGAVGTFDVPLGYRYHDVEIVAVDSAITTLTPLTLIGDIGVYRNGVCQRLHTAEELNHQNILNGSQYGHQNPTTVARGAINNRQMLPIFFSEPWRKDKVDTDFPAWNVDRAWGWNSFQVKVTLLANLPATASIIAYAWVDDVMPVVNGGVQPIVKVYRQQLPCGGTTTDITTLDARDAYQVISLKNPTTGSIAKVSLKRNGQLFMDQVDRADNVAHLAGKSIAAADSKTRATFGYDIVLDADDPTTSALVATGQSLWLQIICGLDDNGTPAAPTGSFIALIQRLGQFD